MKTEVSYFISPHGFGHATRTIAILEKLHEHIPELHVNLLTTLPESLFQDLPISWSYHRVMADIGLIQKDAFTTDLQQTTDALDRFIPFSSELTQTCCHICASSELLLCDISPLGIHLGKLLGIPSVLIENFTWEWIYRALPGAETLLPFIPYIEELYNSATYRVQTEPLCRKAACNITCQPIARLAKTDKQIIDKTVKNSGKKIILITMGGIPHNLPFIPRLSELKEYFFILAGQSVYQRLAENVLSLPFDTSFSHPDLIKAASLVVCKSGYSTIAECAQTDTSICCINRPGFRESEIIEQYVRQQLGGTVIDYLQFHNGFWLDMLPTLLNTRKNTTLPNGSTEAADFISDTLTKDM